MNAVDASGWQKLRLASSLRLTKAQLTTRNLEFPNSMPPVGVFSCTNIHIVVDREGVRSRAQESAPHSPGTSIQFGVAPPRCRGPAAYHGIQPNGVGVSLAFEFRAPD